eukprot:CAMPEP_0114285766 /NCGR_PEP_ID=MMETSP0059-20121206/5381_1 /TAXON_ID=36894 /ORGANISM="Pyramimonas parkeae, Strain CCMP726" /LENGTH=292 /DNA_ID=CAMNT_0001406725 /DNA_START=204 /DNA_END=1079 /DNA_ORIENTATION=-
MMPRNRTPPRMRPLPVSPKAVEIRFEAEHELNVRRKTPLKQMSPGGAGCSPGRRERARAHSSTYAHNSSPRLPRGMLPALPGEPAMESPTSGHHHRIGDMDVPVPSDQQLLHGCAQTGFVQPAPLPDGRHPAAVASGRGATGMVAASPASPLTPLMVRKVASAPDSHQKPLVSFAAGVGGGPFPVMRMRLPPGATSSPRYQGKEKELEVSPSKSRSILRQPSRRMGTPPRPTSNQSPLSSETPSRLLPGAHVGERDGSLQRDSCAPPSFVCAQLHAQGGRLDFSVRAVVRWR